MRTAGCREPVGEPLRVVRCHLDLRVRTLPAQLAAIQPTGWRLRFLYEKVYCARGDAENRIKELKALQIDRTSCQTFSANQLRVLLTAAAYVLMQELRLGAADTACARAQVPWLRDRLLKLGVQVVCSVRRIVLRLPRATPDLAAWRHIAFALGARAG